MMSAETSGATHVDDLEVVLSRRPGVGHRFVVEHALFDVVGSKITWLRTVRSGLRPAADRQ